MRSALTGVNAAVVGMLLAFLYDPVWTNAIRSKADFGLALAGFVLLMFWKLPAWLVVVLTAAGGAAIRFAQGMS
jgi:chromate transporter